MRLLLALGGLVCAAAVSLAGQPCYTRPIYYQEQVKQIIQKVFVAETVLVPVPVPAALLVNLAAPSPLPPVTIAPQALVEAQGSNAALLQRLQTLEAKLDQLLSQPQMLKTADALPARPTLQQVAGVFSANCAQCHTGKNARAEVRLFDDQGNYGPNLPMAPIMAAVRSGRMPKGPNPMPEEHKTLLEAFAR